MHDEATNPFAALDLPARVPVDQTALRRAWLARTAALHPDRAPDPAAAAQALARINAARNTLASPPAAAAALINLIAPHDVAQHKDMPADFPMRMLETREQLDATIESCDTQAAKTLAAEAQSAIDTATQNATARLQSNQPTTQDLRDARTELNTINAYQRIIDTLKAAGLIETN